MSLEIKPIELSDKEKFWLEELDKITNGTTINGVFIEGYIYLGIKYVSINGEKKKDYTDEEIVEESKKYLEYKDIVFHKGKRRGGLYPYISIRP